MAGSSYPGYMEFVQSVQDPKHAFRNPELQQVDIERNKRGQPSVWSGNFAVVFKACHSGTKTLQAIRIFTSPSQERQERYQLIDAYINSQHVESLVRFDYEDADKGGGVRCLRDGRFYPLITMDWVNGETLFDWLRPKCYDKDQKSIQRVAELWVETIEDLYRAKIAHGDLQQANIMVANSGKLRLKLVDYDCMCVPALVGRPNAELGVVPYQHPSRTDDTPLSLDLDNFSALFILVALKALAAQPSLWDTYIEKRDYDKLLFQVEDLTDRSAPLFGDLKRSPDPEVWPLCDQLIHYYNAKISPAQVPSLIQFLISDQKVSALLDGRQFDEALELLSRGKKQIGDIRDGKLRDRVKNAKERVDRRVALEKARESGDEAAMQQLYSPSLLDNYPRAEAAVKEAKKAPQVLPVLRRLEEAQKKNSLRGFVQEWDANQALLTGRKSAQKFAAQAANWRARNQACDAMLALLRAAPDAKALRNAWKRLRDLGGHPELDARQKDIERQIHREESFANVLAVAREINEDADRALVNAWQESLFAGWDRADSERDRVAQATARLEVLDRLRRQTSLAVSLQGERSIVRIASALPAAYSHQRRARVQEAAKRVAAVADLLRALGEPASDLKIVDSWQRVEKAHAGSLVPPEHGERLELARRRMPLLAALRQIPQDYPVKQAHQFDDRLLKIWRDDLLRNSHDAQPWKGLHQQARRREQALIQLAKAIKGKDSAGIAAHVKEPCLQGYQFPLGWKHDISTAAKHVQTLHDLLEVVGTGNRARFPEVFNAELIRQCPAEFHAYESVLREWIVSEILPVEQIGLKKPRGRWEFIEEDSEEKNKFYIYWDWPKPGVSNRCLLLITRAKPLLMDLPERIPCELCQPIQRSAWEPGGSRWRLAAREGWAGCYVTVWAEVDVGFDKFYSRPLHLGQLGEKPVPGPKSAAGRPRRGRFF